jgi:hypothetical protein
MEQIISWEANEEILLLSWNSKAHYRAHRRRTPVPILSQMNPVHDFPPYFPESCPCALTEQHAMKAYWGSGCIAPRIRNFGTIWRWVVSCTPRSLHPQGKSPWCPLDRRLGGPQSRCGRGGESSLTLSSHLDPRSSQTSHLIRFSDQKLVFLISPMRGRSNSMQLSLCSLLDVCTLIICGPLEMCIFPAVSLH